MQTTSGMLSQRSFCVWLFGSRKSILEGPEQGQDEHRNNQADQQQGAHGEVPGFIGLARLLLFPLPNNLAPKFHFKHL